MTAWSESSAGGGTPRPEKMRCCQYAFTAATERRKTASENVLRAPESTLRSTGRSAWLSGQREMFFRKALARKSLETVVPGTPRWATTRKGGGASAASAGET